MDLDNVGWLVLGLMLGGVGGFGWAQSIYRKLLASYRGFCDEYRAMLDGKR